MPFDSFLYAAEPSTPWIVSPTPVAREAESLLRRLQIPVGSIVTVSDNDSHDPRKLGDLTVTPVSISIEPEVGDAKEIELFTSDGRDLLRDSGDGWVSVEWLAEELGLEVRS